MSIFYIILITLVIYSLIATVVFLISGQKENVAIVFGLGIVGMVLLGIFKLISRIRDIFKYNIGKRAIFVEEATGNKYKCKTKDTKDVSWAIGYRLLKRYAANSEWVDIPDFSKDFIENSKRNCDNCKYDKECQTEVRCKHNEYGEVLDFDKFEK